MMHVQSNKNQRVNATSLGGLFLSPRHIIIKIRLERTQPVNDFSRLLFCGAGGLLLCVVSGGWVDMLLRAY